MHVAYKGAAPALQDVIGGHVQMMFATAASVIGLIKDQKVRALAVTTPKRTALLPDLPTVDELGLKGFDATTWHGLVAPAGTPKEVIDTLSFAVTTALNDPATQKQFVRSRRRHHRQHAEGIRGLHQVRNSEVDHGRQDFRRESRVT